MPFLVATVEKPVVVRVMTLEMPIGTTYLSIGDVVMPLPHLYLRVNSLNKIIVLDIQNSDDDILDVMTFL